jgi:hypothetical protein
MAFLATALIDVPSRARPVEATQALAVRAPLIAGSAESSVRVDYERASLRAALFCRR